MIVSLMGYRGSGKSSVAKELAKQLGWPHADSDDEVERTAQARIAEIFAGGGEAEFRRREAECIAMLVQQDPVVLSLGGGAMLLDKTARIVAAAGPVLWLRCDPEVLLQRVAADIESGARRPSLTELPPRQELERLMLVREPIYARWATWQVDSTHASPGEIARQIAQYLQQLPEGA